MYTTGFYNDEVTKMGNNRNFDTLQYAKRLKAVGVPEKQAEVQAEMMAETIEDKLATKKDLEQVKSELKRDIEASKNELLIKLGGMIVGSLGALVVLMRLFKL
jgi:hypothetical protein